MLDEVQQGGQCYMIFSCIEDSEAKSFERFKSAEEEFERLTNKYPQVRFGLLHGRMANDQKASALQAFSDGHTQVLVATTVVEVRPARNCPPRHRHIF
jgi:ATP-dependent DNA helicase RecG